MQVSHLDIRDNDTEITFPLRGLRDWEHQERKVQAKKKV